MRVREACIALRHTLLSSTHTLEAYATPPVREALEKACGYVKGRPNPIDWINKGIPAELQYDPGAYRSESNPLSYFNYPTCLCMNNAKLLRYLLRSIGIAADEIYVWGGDKADTVVFYYYQIPISSLDEPNVSFRVMVRQKDFADLNPHFTYHALTVSGGVTYDPSPDNAVPLPIDDYQQIANAARRATHAEGDCQEPFLGSDQPEFRTFLLTIVFFDGDLKTYFRDISTFTKTKFDQVFENCEDYPLEGTGDFERFWNWI